MLLFLLSLIVNAKEPSDDMIKKMIGQMLVVGFDSQVIIYHSRIVEDIEAYNLGGVILFDRFYNNRARVKNILSPYQLRNLLNKFQKITKKPFFISIDQEGGSVARLKKRDGFLQTPSAQQMAKLTKKEATFLYDRQSKMLRDLGINLNFAPVVDLASNPKNRVIVGLQRAYSDDVSEVVENASILIESQKKHHIVSVLKHFPGHGSSMRDSHKGFVDISDTWSSEELKPYMKLIAEGEADVIMTAHVFNSHIDSKYPATLSYLCNTTLLREKMGFTGLIISDDMQMGALTKHYSLKERVTLAINAGVNILLFGNQLQHNSVSEIVETIFEEVKNGNISLKKIEESNQKIKNLHTKYSIVQKPILFGDKRKYLTKKYIKKHYQLDVKNIKITPKIVVVHWTAVMSFEKSFERLNAELLFSDRADIASASALNVSSHFLVDRDGTIYQLMPDNWMARHVIGLNYSSIGIENVGGEANKKEDLTPQQLEANIRLIEYLKSKYPSIENVIGHYEYRDFEGSSLWLEKDAGYRTQKVDPGVNFMYNLREALVQ